MTVDINLTSANLYNKRFSENVDYVDKGMHLYKLVFDSVLSTIFNFGTWCITIGNCDWASKITLSTGLWSWHYLFLLPTTSASICLIIGWIQGRSSPNPGPSPSPTTNADLYQSSSYIWILFQFGTGLIPDLYVCVFFQYQWCHSHVGPGLDGVCSIHDHLVQSVLVLFLPFFLVLWGSLVPAPIVTPWSLLFGKGIVVGILRHSVKQSFSVRFKKWTRIKLKPLNGHFEIQLL